MRAKYSPLLVLLCAVAAGCTPDKKCGGSLYYDPINISCRGCPKDSLYKNGTCECKDQYEFVNHRCVPMDGAVFETPDAGTDDDGGIGKADCSDYCQFAKVCIADNMLAAAALADVVSGLKADDSAACATQCNRVTGGDGSSDPVVACIEAGREKAACAGDSTQVGLMNGFGLIGDCCRTRTDNALCKSICTTLTANALTKGQVDFCK